MLLRETDIALFAINWNDKASNIKSMAATLDLGLESFVFVDDNPVERKQVRDAHPEVAIPELPEDPAAWLPVIQAAGYFEQVSFSAEDLARTEYYRGNARRRVQAQTASDPRAFLESLQMVLTIDRFEPLGRPRIAQLIAKSNQFNLTTRRYSESEIAALESDPTVDCLQFRLEDMFGDNGMISVVISRKHEQYWDIELWIMSCRVLGRGVEQAVLEVLAGRASAAGVRELRGRYLPTAKNGLVRDHYKTLGFTKIDDTEQGGSTWRLALSGFAPADVPIAKRDRTGDR
jgi:FkbH-like protein